jgi:hypothetical protein
MTTAPFEADIICAKRHRGTTEVVSFPKHSGIDGRVRRAGRGEARAFWLQCSM